MMTNIGMNQTYMSNLPRTQVYSPLQTVSGLRAGVGQQEPSDAQQILGGLQMANTANNAVKGLTGFDAASSVKDYIKEAMSNPIDKAALMQDFGFAEDAPSVISSVSSSPSVVSSFGESVGDYPDLSSYSSEFMDMGSEAGSSSVPYLGMATSLANGNWGSAVGNWLGTNAFGPIGGMVGSLLGNTIEDGLSTWEDNLMDVTDQVNDATGGLGDPIGGAVYDTFGGATDLADEIFGGGGGGGCFLTTACMRHHDANFSDDCRELTVLRDVRDNYIRKTPDGEELVTEYYRTAPGQVVKLESRPDAKEVFDKMYDEFILPAVEQAESGDYHASYETYLKLVDWVNNETQENDNV